MAGDHKAKQSQKHNKNGKCKKAFVRTVKRTGKWRGKKTKL